MTRYEWSNRVLSADGPQSPTVRLVLVALLTFVNEAKGYAWPGVEKIAERSGHKSVRTVQEALGEAEETGWLRRDAVPGRVTLYYPSLPEDKTARMTPAKTAGPPPQSTASPPQGLQGTPAESAGESWREPVKESKKEGAPSCPLCFAAMERKTPRRKAVPAFWGCSQFKSTGCKGKRELDWDKAATTSAPSAHATASFIDREREHKRKVAAERAMQPVTDAVGMAARLIRGTA